MDHINTNQYQKDSSPLVGINNDLLIRHLDQRDKNDVIFYLVFYQLLAVKIESLQLKNENSIEEENVHRRSVLLPINVKLMNILF